MNFILFTTISLIMVAGVFKILEVIITLYEEHQRINRTEKEYENGKR